MALSFKPAEGTTVLASAGVASQPALTLPDNCTTLIVVNSDNVNSALVGWAQNAGAFNPTTAVHIAPGRTMTLNIGSLSSRSNTPGDFPFYSMVVGGPTLLQITYVNGTTA